MELPSINWGIRTSYTRDQLFVGGINASSSETWLRNFKSSNAISFPLFFDAGKTITNLFQVGGEFNNLPPTYFIIDKNGIIRYRTDNVYNKTEEMKELIDRLLTN